MSEMIKSQNELFKGEQFEKPKRALIIGRDAEGYPVRSCPNCGKTISDLECDVMGAEPWCLFCPFCNQEFEQ